VKSESRAPHFGERPCHVYRNRVEKMAGSTGLEPATSGLDSPLQLMLAQVILSEQRRERASVVTASLAVLTLAEWCR
jgi:hypothetical protein